MSKREPLPQYALTALIVLLITLVGLGAWALSLRRENAELRARLGDSPAGENSDAQSSEGPEGEPAEDPSPDPPPPTAPSPPPAAAEPAGPRILTAAQRELMATTLRNISADADRRVWFATAQGDTEAQAFQGQLQAVFEEAGWRTERAERVRFPIRPGIYFLMADTEPPDYVLDVLAAVDQASSSVTSGRGYREFFDERTEEDPAFNGFAMTADQKFVIVVGRSGA